MQVVTEFHGGRGKNLAKAAAPVVVRRLKALKIDFATMSSKSIRAAILDSLRADGWSGSIRVDAGAGITITSIKNDVALCLQLGNVGRYYADVMKLQYLYLKDRARAAIYIVPTKIAAKEIGSNIAHHERVCRELMIFRHSITIPLCVIGIEGE